MGLWFNRLRNALVYGLFDGTRVGFAGRAGTLRLPVAGWLNFSAGDCVECWRADVGFSRTRTEGRMLLLILLIVLFSRRCWWGYGYHPYGYGYHPYPYPYPYPYGAYTPYDPYWRARYYGYGYGYGYRGCWW